MVSLRRSSTDVLEAPDEQRGGIPIPDRSAAFPRVNLMPAVIAAEAKERHAKTIMVGAAAASVLAVGGLYLLATNEVNAAQERLDTAAAQGVVLQKELARYSDVPKVQNEVAIAQTQAYNAMGGEVRWSFLLNNLSLTIPRNTSLISLSGSVNGVAPQPAAAGAATAADDTAVISALGRPGIGQISYEGEAVRFTDFAAFLDVLAKQKTLLDPFPGEVKRAENEGDGLAFSANVTVAEKALSHRYDPKAGN
jgi:Tfp pilus assembly protein PilN